MGAAWAASGAQCSVLARETVSVVTMQLSTSLRSLHHRPFPSHVDSRVGGVQLCRRGAKSVQDGSVKQGKLCRPAGRTVSVTRKPCAANPDARTDHGNRVSQPVASPVLPPTF